jgi:hypothetical protein
VESSPEKQTAVNVIFNRSLHFYTHITPRCTLPLSLHITFAVQPLRANWTIMATRAAVVTSAAITVAATFGAAPAITLG